MSEGEDQSVLEQLREARLANQRLRAHLLREQKEAQQSEAQIAAISLQLDQRAADIKLYFARLQQYKRNQQSLEEDDAASLSLLRLKEDQLRQLKAKSHDHEKGEQRLLLEELEELTQTREQLEREKLQLLEVLMSLESELER